MSGAMVKAARLKSKTAPVHAVADMTWSDLAAVLTTHQAGSKDGPSWMPADIDPGPRKGDRVRAVTALVLDVEAKARDEGAEKRVIGPLPPPLSDLAADLVLFGWAGVLATSHSHQAPAADGGTLGPRYRVTLRLSRPLQPAELEPLAKHVARLLGVADAVDTGCMEAARLFYLPRCPAERRHLAESQIVEGQPLPVDELLAPAVALTAPLPARRGNSGSVIDAFNAQADIPTLLDRHGYKPAGGLRWLWPGSTTGAPGVVWYPDKERVFSGHSDDPLHAPGRAHDAFGAYCALDHGGDTTRALRAAAALLGMDRAQKPAATAGGESQAVADRAEAANAPAWCLVPVHDLDSAVIPPQGWAWNGYIPANQVTLFAADGGTGKSLMALMLAVCTAVGMPLFGVETTAAPVVFFSAEDDADTVRRRLAHICRVLGVPAEMLRGRLLVLDASNIDAELFGPVLVEGVPKMGATKIGGDLGDFLRDLPAPLLIVDNASDTFAGNEVARPEVRGFVRWLARIVRQQKGAVLLLAHVNANTARGFGGSGSAYSGSTAWNNSARSRLYLSRDKDGSLTLEHQKSNYGPMRDPMRLVWPRDGLPMLDEPLSGVVLHIQTTTTTRSLLRLIHEFTARGEFVSTATTSRTHAGKLLRNAPGFPLRTPDAEVFELLRTAERRGWLDRVSFKGADRKERERWEVTPAGCEAVGLAATAATAATTEVPAPGAVPAEPCGDCGDFAGGVWGGSARTESGVEVTAEVTE